MNSFLYWRMANGHEHSYLQMNTQNITEEYATENEEGILTQKQYISYVENTEHTTLEDIEIIMFDEITEEFAQDLLEKDMIADFENDNGEIIIEFY